MTARKIALIAFGASLAIVGLQAEASARSFRNVGLTQTDASAPRLARSISFGEPALRSEAQARYRVALNPQPLPPGDERDPW